jgi:hypothetical protein
LKEHKLYTHGILLAGYFVIAVGVLGFVTDFITRNFFSYPFNLGIILGNGATTLVGLFALLISKRLMNIEERLDRIEGVQLPTNSE